MKNIVLILFAIAAFSSNAQELKNDTIPWGNIQIVMSLPDLSIRKPQIERYEEGFYKIYSLIFGSRLYRYSKPPYIIVHAGFDAEMVLPEPDRIIYDCKLGM